MFLPGSRAIGLLTAVLSSAVMPLRAQDEQADPIAPLLAEGRFEEVLPLVQQRERAWSAAVRRNDDVENRLNWAESLSLLGAVEDRLNKFDAALNHLRLAHDLAQEAKAEPATLGDTLDELGRTEFRAGHYAEAEATLRDAIAQRELLPLAEREPWLSASRDHLALLYLEIGRYEEAGRIFHATLAAAGPDPLVRAQRHGYLARYFHAMRSYAATCEHYQRAIDLITAERGPDDPALIPLIGNLGLAYLLLAPDGEAMPEARMLLSRAAELAEKQPRTHEITLALGVYLNNLGLLSLREDDFESARKVFEESLLTLTPRVGDTSPVLAPFYNNLGYANQRLERYKEAQDAFHQAAVRYKDSVGTRHQRSIETTANLVANLMLVNAPAETIEREIEFLTRNNLDLLDQVIDFGTERQRLNYMNRVDPISLPCSLGRNPVFIANTILRTKGRLLDSMLVEQEEASELLELHRAKQRQLDDLLFRFESRENLQGLRDEITAIEAQLRNESANGSHRREAIPDWSAVQATLPPHSAFVDIVRYRNYQADPGGPLSYGAILLAPGGDPKWIPLGSEDDLDTWLGIMKDRLDFRAYTLSSSDPLPPPAMRLRTALRRLHDLFWAPVAAQLPPGTETIGISPDGNLNFLSFAVLLDEDERLLTSKFRKLVYTSSARDLLVNEARPSFSEGPWAILTVPEFESETSSGEATSPNDLDRVVLEMVETCPALPGAREELRLLHDLIPPKARGPEFINASETELRALKESPVVLHLSTHALFLPTAQEDDFSGIQDFDYQPERFYRSGLVLTEAKRALARRAHGEEVPVDRDGVMFSDELTTLPLHHTRLVTLSSCESGLGESKVSGQGVQGLRRGFTMAGTQNILLSLWPVSDNSTPEFMADVYRLCLATDQIGQSLWEAQRQTFAAVDTGDDEALEEAILRYGCFVLCQRGPLEAAVPMPRLEKEFRYYWAVALGLTALFAFLLTRPAKQKGPPS